MIQTLVWNDNISLDNVERFEVAIEQLLESNSKGIILNLDRVRYLNSRALGIIANTAMEAKKLKKQFVIINNQDSVREIFNIVSFHTIVKVFSHELNAKKYLNEYYSLSRVQLAY